MSKKDFIWICGQYSIDPSIVMEDEFVKDILKSKRLDGIKKQLFNKLRNTYDLGEIYEVLDYYKELVGNMNKVNNELKQKIKSGCIRLTP